MTFTYVRRAAWSAHPTVPFDRLHDPVSAVYVHHLAAPAGVDPAAQMRATEAFHIRPRRIRAIAYTTVTYPDGTVYEGRGWGAVGGHTEGHNATSYGLCFAGNFEAGQPTDAALDSTAHVIALGMLDGRIRPEARIAGHRDTKPTACPGRHLYDALDDLRRRVRDLISIPAPPAVPPLELPNIVDQEARMRRALVTVRTDADGNGWADFPGPETVPVGAVINGDEWPPAAGHYDTTAPTVRLRVQDGRLRVIVTGAAPKKPVSVWVSAA